MPVPAGPVQSRRREDVRRHLRAEAEPVGRGCRGDVAGRAGAEPELRVEDEHDRAVGIRQGRRGATARLPDPGVERPAQEIGRRRAVDLERASGEPARGWSRRDVHPIAAVREPDDRGAAQEPRARQRTQAQARLRGEAEAVVADCAGDPVGYAAAVDMRVVEAPASVGEALDVARHGRPPLPGLRGEVNPICRNSAEQPRGPRRRRPGGGPVVEPDPAVREANRARPCDPLTRRQPEPWAGEHRAELLEGERHVGLRGGRRGAGDGCRQHERQRSPTPRPGHAAPRYSCSGGLSRRRSSGYSRSFPRRSPA